MRRSQTSHFTLRQDGEATLIDITPARPDIAFMAAAVLLGGLFGLPALAVVLNPARHDALSLGAATFAILVVALAALALRRAISGRRRRQLRLDPTGLTADDTHIPWPNLGERRIALPDASPHNRAEGIHGLAATIAARHRAAQAQLLQARQDGTPPLLLAGGLDAETATRLDDALTQAAARYRQ
jgi:hypothetical protein